MFPFQKSLLGRMVFSFLVLSLLIVSLMTGLTYSFFVHGAEKRVVEQMDALSRLKVEMLGRWVNDQYRRALTLARLPEVRIAAVAVTGSGAARSQAYAGLRRFFDAFVRDYPEIEELQILDREGGRVAFSTVPAHEGQYRVLDTYFVEGMAGPVIQNVYPSPVTLQPTMTIAVPLQDEAGAVFAVLATHLNLDAMDRIVQDRAGLGTSGEAYLVDRYNVFVSSERFGRADYPRGVHSKGIDAALGGASGSGEYPNYAGVPVIGVYRWVAERDLALLVEIPQAEAFALPRSQTATLLILGTVLALLSAGAVYVLARQIARPILAVQATAVRVTAGDLKAQAPVMTRDEIGALAGSFNQMTLRVRELYDELARKEEHFRSLIESSLDILAVVDPGMKVAFLSPSVERALGWEVRELLGIDPSPFIHPDDLRAVRRTFLRLRGSPEEAIGQIALRVRRKDGGWRTLDATARSLIRHPAIAGIVVSARDITDWKALEDRLIQAQKLEAVGRLAGGVAHDFNNLLTAVLGYSEALASQKQLDGESGEWVSEIKKAANRAATLTRQLLAYSRKQVLRPRVVDVNALVVNLRAMLRRLIGEDVQIKTRLAPDLLRVKADPNQLEQVIMNLALNARDAMPEGGEIVLGTENLSAGAEGIQGYPEAAPGPYVQLSVTDSGVGMDEAVREKVFDPFFTTKEVGKGTGLGLSVAYGIVKQSGGHILVESEIRQGSTFRVLLPATSEAAEEPAEEVQPARVPAGRETVLVVEDEDSVRRMIAMALEQAGYVVEAVASPQEAIRWAGTAAGVDLVVTDVALPGMNGRQMAEVLSGMHPHAKVLFISGYTEDEVLRDRVRQDGLRFLQKPFLPKVLAAKVREMLDGR